MVKIEANAPFRLWPDQPNARNAVHDNIGVSVLEDLPCKMFHRNGMNTELGQSRWLGVNIAPRTPDDVKVTPVMIKAAKRQLGTGAAGLRDDMIEAMIRAAVFAGRDQLPKIFVNGTHVVVTSREIKPTFNHPESFDEAAKPADE